MGKKEEWPECVGTKGEEASEMIKEENPELAVEVIHEYEIVTCDYDY